VVKQVMLALVVAVALAPGVPRAESARATLSGIVHLGKASAAGGVVWLDAPGGTPASKPSRVVLTQHNMMFDPKLLAVRTGTVVEFPNDDRVFHNVFSFHEGKVFDLGTYPVGASKSVTFSKAGVSRVFCNIHPHMAAYVVAVDSSYFATVKSDGMFTIADVPAGTYTYHAWRTSGPLAQGTVTVNGDTSIEIAWP
jgi:plastocyanin